jgi:dTDP-4-dehydrorhamnose reductase
MKVLVTGSTGLLGSVLLPHLRAHGFEAIGHGMTQKADIQADLCDINQARRVLQAVAPDAIVNLVCLSNVDTCESNPNLAYRLNVLALENLVKAVDERSGVRLIHVSSDQIYDGPGEHKEDDITPRNVYAITKYAAELVALHANGLILRTNFFGKSHAEGRASFSDWLIQQFHSGKSFVLFTDVFFSPLSVESLSKMIAMALLSDIRGVFNVGSHAGMSKRDFAYALAARVGVSTGAAREGHSTDVSLKASRPTGMLMDCGKFEAAFGLKLPTLREEIMSAEV